MKKCIHCKESKQLSEFTWRKDRKQWLTSCIPCTTEMKKESEKALRSNPQWKQALRDRRIKNTYGLTPDTYNVMYAQQLGCCDICGSEEKDVTGARLHIDHDHDTGEVRGLLCSNCNRGLGMLKDSSEIINKAVAYLKHHGK